MIFKVRSDLAGRSPIRLVAPVLYLFAALVLGSCAPENGDESKSAEDSVSMVSAYHDSDVIALTGIDSSNVLDLLKAQHAVEYRNTLSGAFVTAIDDLEVGSAYS